MSDEGKEIVKEVAAGINRYFGGVLQHGMGMFEDRFKFMRWERQLNLIDRANCILHERGLDSPTRDVAQKFLLPYLDASSLEEESFLQDKWAHLLANAADNSSPIELRRNFISILENLTSYECKFFEDIARHEVDKLSESEHKVVHVAEYPERFIISPDKPKHGISHEIETALNNLIRLGLLYNQTIGGIGWVSITGLGKEFYSACS